MPRGNRILSLLLFTAPGLNFGAPLGDKAGDLEILNEEVNSGSAVAHLSRFGYLGSPGSGQAALLTGEGVTAALKQFQRFGGINVTGKLDQQTVELMGTPRCGVPDVLDDELVDDLEILDVDDNKTLGVGEREENKTASYFPTRRKRYALQGSRWRTKSLTYKIGKYASGVSRSQLESQVRQAFSMWERASPLTFRRSSGRVNIEIRFETGAHGDEDNFDGPGGVVAHAFFPEFGGDAHFDDQELWTINKYTGTSLLQSLTHELGHSLGLLHSSNSKAMMAPYHRGWDPNLSLHRDDIEAIEALYGSTTQTGRGRGGGRRRTRTRARSRVFGSGPFG